MSPLQFSTVPLHSNPSVGEVARRVYPDTMFDCTLPQDWVNAVLEFGRDPRGHFVWIYPDGVYAGRPGPITREGVNILADMSLYR